MILSGGWNCKIAVTPTLTARVAVARLLSGMGLNPRHNKYALFEKLDNTYKVGVFVVLLFNTYIFC